MAGWVENKVARDASSYTYVYADLDTRSSQIAADLAGAKGA
ncbi:MAG: hypothetical protein ACYDHH_27060 [Solirubrobacteraceae bacterium]